MIRSPEPACRNAAPRRRRRWRAVLVAPLLLLASYGKHDKPVRAVPPISQETLAEMIGTTRSRVNFFMKKFQRLGFIDYTDGLKVNNSLLTVVLHD